MRSTRWVDALQHDRPHRPPNSPGNTRIRLLGISARCTAVAGQHSMPRGSAYARRPGVWSIAGGRSDVPFWDTRRDGCPGVPRLGSGVVCVQFPTQLSQPCSDWSRRHTHQVEGRIELCEHRLFDLRKSGSLLDLHGDN
jgi:hypothetical protein